MDTIEIIQYQGEEPRPLAPDEYPATSGKIIVFWRYLNDVRNPPSYNPTTHKITSTDHAIDGEDWINVYTYEPMTPQEIEDYNLAQYQQSLDWEAFSTEFALGEHWTAWIDHMACNTELCAAGTLILMTASYWHNEPELKLRMGQFKNAIALAGRTFTPLQLDSLEDSLFVLGVDWTWASL